MSNQLSVFGHNPVVLPEGPYLKIVAHFLDQQGLSHLSLLSRRYYNATYKIAIEVLSVCYKAELPLRLLTFYERTYPERLVVLGNDHIDLELIKKNKKILTFASSIKNNRFLIILNKAFPERIILAEGSEKKAQRYHKQLREEIFMGTAGLDAFVFLKNIRQCIQNYQNSAHPSILNMLQNALTIFPSEPFRQLLSMLEKNPAMHIWEHSDFMAFEKAVKDTLTNQSIVQRMQDIKDVISEELNPLNFFKFHLSDALSMCLMSLEEILPHIQYLLQVSTERAEQVPLSESDNLQFKTILTLILHYYNLNKQGDSSPFVEVDIHGFMIQVKTLLSLLEKGKASASSDFNKRDRHMTVLWRAIFLKDRESLHDIIDSPACLYFKWKSILYEVLKNQQSDLFLYLISHPQIFLSLAPEKLDSILEVFFTVPSFFLSIEDPSVLLPLLSYSAIDWGRFSQYVMAFLLPVFLGEYDISPPQWIHICSLYRPSSKMIGITLNALVRKDKTNLIKTLLELPTLHHEVQNIPPTSASPHRFIHFFESYPLLWDRLCYYPEEGSQLLARMLRDVNTKYLFDILGSETCAETFQFLLVHPEMIQASADIQALAKEWKVPIILKEFKHHCSLSTLISQEAIQQALEQSIKMEDRLELTDLNQFQIAIHLLAAFLFAHDRYFLKLFVHMAQKDSLPEDRFNHIFTLVQTGAPLLTILATPPEDHRLKETPYKMLDLLFVMGCLEWVNKEDEVPEVGWDTIFHHASDHPPLLDLLASHSLVAVHIPPAFHAFT